MRAVVINDMFCRGSILCCALLLCCLCLWPAGARALSSDAARACVVEAGGAVDNADAACFEQLVDMDAILNEAVDLFMKEAAKPENSSLLPPMLALMFSGAAMAEDNGLGVRKLLVSEARAFVHNGIASGAFAGLPDGRLGGTPVRVRVHGPQGDPQCEHARAAGQGLDRALRAA